MEENASKDKPNAIVPALTKHCDREEHQDCKGFYETMKEKNGNIVSLSCICPCHEEKIPVTLVPEEKPVPLLSARLAPYEKFDEKNPISIHEFTRLAWELGIKLDFYQQQVLLNDPGHIIVRADLRTDIRVESWSELDKRIRG